MPGAIEFDGSRNDELRAVKSEADGIYHIPAYPAGLPMRLVVSWKNEATVTEIPPVKTANAELPTVTLQKARSIRVRMVDLDGHPLANTKIYYGPHTRGKRMSCAESLPPVSHSLQHSVKTDADGNVTFKGIPSGYACDFWLPDDYYSWKRILPDQLEEKSLPAFTLSDKLRIRFLDTQGKPMKIDQIKNGTWGLNHNYYRTGHCELSHDGLSPEDIAEGWYTIPKKKLLFQGPGAEGQVWAETPDGAIQEFTGVFPQFDNTIVLRESRPVQLAEPAVTPPFDIPENAVANLVVDESGQPISDASLTTDQHQNEHLSQTDNGSGWYLLEWPSYHYAPGYLTFFAPGYAPQWTVNIAKGEGRKIVLSQNTHLSGQLHAPDGSSPGVVDLTLLATRVRLYADGTPREVSGPPLFG